MKSSNQPEMNCATNQERVNRIRTKCASLVENDNFRSAGKMMPKWRTLISRETGGKSVACLKQTVGLIIKAYLILTV